MTSKPNEPVDLMAALEASVNEAREARRLRREGQRPNPAETRMWQLSGDGLSLVELRVILAALRVDPIPVKLRPTHNDLIARISEIVGVAEGWAASVNEMNAREQQP